MASREDSLSLYSGYVNFKENPLDPYEMELNLFIGSERWLYCNEPNSPLPLDDSAQSFTTSRDFVPLLQPPPYPAPPTPIATFAKDVRSLPSSPFEPSIAMIPPCGANNNLDCTVVRGVIDKQFQKSSTYSAEALQDSQFQSAPFIFSSFQEPDARARKQNDHGQNQYHAQRDAGCLSHGEPSRPACNISFTRIYTSNTPPPTSPKTRRVGKACQNCRIKKRKCSKSRPCKACEIDGRKCEAPPEKSDRKRKKISRVDGPKAIPT